MKISSRQFIKEAVTKPAFVESLKVKYETDPDFIVKTQDKNGEEIIDINKDAVILINKFYGYKKLNSVNQASSDYSALIDSLPSTWREAADLMSKEIASMSADPTKTALISLGLKEEDVANKEVRAWLEDRYVKNNVSEIHPISEALETLKEYVASKDAILSRIKTDEDFNSNLESSGFTEDKLKNILSLSVDNMVSILSKYKYGEKTTIRTSGVEIREGERVGKVGEWNVWLPQTQETSAKIAGYDDVTKDPKTTWCTGRTKGSNLFYHYISRGNIISFLFYIIRDNPSDVRDWLSMGFLGDTDYGLDSIRPVYSEDGGVTIDRDNKGLSEEDFRQILGKNYSAIFDMMRNKIAELGGENPATKELENYAKNLSLFKKALWDKSKEEKRDFADIVLEFNPSYDVKGLAISICDPSRIIENRSEPWAAPYFKDSVKRAAEDAPGIILEYGREVWAKPYLNQAAKNAAKINSYALSEIITEEWIQPYLDGVAEIYLEENPMQIIKCRSEDWAMDYFDRAVEKVGNTNPKDVLYYSSLENEDGDEYDNWPAPYVEKSIKKILEEEPSYILRNSDEPWAKPYLYFAAKKVAEKDPESFIYYSLRYPYSDFDSSFRERPWMKPYFHDALIRLIEESPSRFFEGHSERSGDWLTPYFNYAIKEIIKEDPGSFIKNYSDEYWATKKHDRLSNGKSLIDLAKKFLKIEKENEQYDSYVKTEKIRKGSSLVQSKLDLLKSTLNKLGINISFDLN